MRWSGIEAVALTKLDVLDELAEIRVATAYQLGGQTTSEFPDDAEEVGASSPVYETLPGWQANSSRGVTASEKLPELALRYVARLEELVGVPVVVISTGPRREETIVRRVQPLAGWNVGL